MQNETKNDELSSEQFATQLRLLNVDPRFYNKAVSLLELEAKHSEVMQAVNTTLQNYKLWLCTLMKMCNVTQVQLPISLMKELGNIKVSISAIKQTIAENQVETTHIEISYETPEQSK
jgi:hypothetical protein